MGLWARLARLFGGGTDRAAREAAERLLLEADFGVGATEEILDKLGRGEVSEQALERIVVEQLGPPATPLARAQKPPTVVLVFGVNGTGKTTTVAKLAHRLSKEGRRVLRAAADTFRAGATEQLETWADRLRVPFVGANSGKGADPAAVAFDAVEAGTARGIDTVLLDTAGRLHTDERLREEVRKVVRVVGKRQAGAPHPTQPFPQFPNRPKAGQQTRRIFGAGPLTSPCST